MKAIVRYDYGSPDVLRLEEVETPVCRDNQALIRVRAASVNPLDWHYVRGLPYFVRLVEPGPFKPKRVGLGVDVAGEIVAVGKDFTRFQLGDAVFGNRFGAFGQYVCAPERSLAAKPANVSFEEAAAVPVAAITALQGLRDQGKLAPGQRVLVNGASGGVGTFAVQIAKAFGAEVTGVCSTRNVELVRSIGADHVIDYTREDFTKTEQRYDVILDMVGNHSLSDRMRVLTPTGRLVLVGSTEKGRWLGPLKGMLIAALVSGFGTRKAENMLAEIKSDDLARLGDLMREGKIRSVIDRRYRLEEVPKAIHYVEEGHARGKVVITLDDVGEAAPVTAHFGEGAENATMSALAVVALIVAGVGGPALAAFALHRRFRLRHPARRPYRWGYYFGIQSVVGGVAFGILLESGVAAVAVCGATYAVLAWFFAQRRRWAWIALTFFSFNPVVWLINLIYLKKRWEEDCVPST